VLVSRVSGPDLLVEPGVNGEFLDADPERTARLLDGYGDARRREAHGDAARAKVARFTWDASIERHRELYRRLSSATSRRSG